MSLADVLPSCLAALGVDEFPNRLGLARAKSAVVILVDGLGELNLKAHRGHARFLNGGSSLGGLVTVFPSTTASALASLTTGSWPGQHGLVGYKVREPESDRIINQLRDLTQVPDLSTWALQPPLYDHARAAGVTPAVVSHPRFAATPLTSVIHAGAEVVSAATLEDRFERAREILLRNGSTLTVVYVSELDEAAHKWGVNSTEWTVWLEKLDLAVSEFTKKLPADVGVILTADHGVVDVAGHKQLLYGVTDQQLLGVGHVGGEPRCLQLFLDGSRPLAEVVESWTAEFGSVADVLTREEVMTRALMGPVHPEAARRMGDVFVAARKLVAFYDARDTAHTGRSMVGQHGAMSDEELRIPSLRWGAFA